MTCKDSVKWLESLKKTIGQSQYQGLWHYEQALAETIELLQSDRLVELPNIKIGQELFYIDQYEKRVKSDIVSKLTFEKNDLGIDTGVWSEGYGFSMFFSDVGKNIFLTEQEAEEKLKELNNGTT